jgi:signal transduction histidine kinase
LKALGAPLWLARLLRAPAWVWVGGFLTIVLLGLALVSRSTPVEGAFYIAKARLAQLNTAQPATRIVALPHSWDDETPALSGTVQYDLAWPDGLGRAQQYALSQAPPNYALYLPRVGARFKVLLNDQLVASEHWDTPGYADTSVVPQWVALPPALLVQPLSANRISVQVQGQLLRKSGLSQVLLGPREAIVQRYHQVYAWQVLATWMVAACSVLLAMLAGLMWSQNQERAFALFALGCAAWAVRLALTPLVNPPMPFAWWFFLHKLSFSLYCGFVYLFLSQVFEFSQPWGRRLVLALMWFSPFWLGLVTVTENYNLYRVWTGVLTGVSTLTLLHMFARARWGLDNQHRLMVVVGLVTMVTGIRDFAVVQLGAPGDGDLRWMTLGSLVFMLTLAWVLVQRTAGYMAQINQLNAGLEQRVADKEAQLRVAFDQLRESERRQTIETERQRLTRDMHDGLGSQLVQTLNLVRGHSTVDAAAVTAMINHALEDLRMTLDSMEPMEGDLPTILGTLRRRIGPALQAAGIELDWQVQEVPPIAVQGQPLDARGVMHLFRFLQEVFANIVKHANATKVEVRTRVELAAVSKASHTTWLSVTDNGQGLGDGYRAGGRGLDNLRTRAQALGAQLHIGSAHLSFANSSGTCVALGFAHQSSTI